MRGTTRKFLIGLTVLGMASGTAWAAHHEGGEGEGEPKDSKHHGKHHKKHPGKMFDEMDADGDGAISADEWMAASKDRFTRHDADGDGSVTRDEMKSAHKKHRRGGECSKDDKGTDGDS